MSSLYRPTVSPAPVSGGIAAPVATAAQKLATRRWFAKLGRVLLALVGAVLAAVAVAYTLQDAEQVSSIGAVPAYNGLVADWTGSGLRELTQIASGVLVNVSLATVVYTSSGAPVAIAANSSTLALTTGITSPDTPPVSTAAGATSMAASSMKRLQAELALRPGGTIPWPAGEARIEGRLILTVTNISNGAVAAAEIDLPLAFIGTFPSSCFSSSGALRDCSCPLGDSDGLGRCRGVFALSGICLAARLGGPARAADVPLTGAAAGVNVVLSPPQGVQALVGSTVAIGPGCAPLPRLPHTPEPVLPPQLDGRVVTAGGGLAVGAYSFYSGAPPAGVPFASVPVAVRAAGDAWPFAMAATRGTGVFAAGSTRFHGGMIACWTLAAVFAVAAVSLDAWLTRADCAKKQAAATEAAWTQTVPLRRDGRLETPTPAETAAADLAAEQAMRQWRRRCITRRAVVITVVVCSAAGLILGALALSGAAPQVCAARTIAAGATVPLPCGYLHDFLAGSGALAGPGAVVARLQVAAMALSLGWLVWLAAPAVVVAAHYAGTCLPRAEAFGDRAWRWLSTAAAPAFFATVLAAQAIGACLWMIALLVWMGQAVEVEAAWCAFLASPAQELFPSACWSAFGLRGYLVLAALFNTAAAMGHLAARAQVRCDGGLCALRCRSLARSTGRSGSGSGSPRHALLIDSDDEDDNEGSGRRSPSAGGTSRPRDPPSRYSEDTAPPKRSAMIDSASGSAIDHHGTGDNGSGSTSSGKRVRYERVGSSSSEVQAAASGNGASGGYRAGLGGRAALADPGASSTGSDDSAAGAGDATASGARGSAVRWPPSAAEHLRAREEYSQSMRRRHTGGGRLPSGSGTGTGAGAGHADQSGGSAIGINSARDAAGTGFLPPPLPAELTAGSGAGPAAIVYPSSRSTRDIPSSVGHSTGAGNTGTGTGGQSNSSGHGAASVGLPTRVPSSHVLGASSAGVGVGGLPPRHAASGGGGGGGGLSLRSGSSRAATEGSAAAGYAPDGESVTSARGREHPGTQRELTNSSSILPGSVSPATMGYHGQPTAVSDDAQSARSARSASGRMGASGASGTAAGASGSSSGPQVRSAWDSPP